MERTQTIDDTSAALLGEGKLCPMNSPVTELEGTWLAVEAAISGQRVANAMGQHLRIAGDRFQVTNWGQVRFGGHFELLPGRARSKIAFDQHESEERFGRWLGIYALDGDRLIICHNGPDLTKPWPKSFRGRGQPGYATVHFVRQG
ncbi:MAG: TIGR03067 domain-containing protein [Pseudomonadota bacterium]